MSKLLKILCSSSILAAMCFVFSCSEGEKNDSGDRSTINIPTNPPQAGNGSLTKGGDMANNQVTNENRTQFVELFIAALGQDIYYSFSSARSARGARNSRPDEYWKETGTYKSTRTVHGANFGRVEIKEEEVWKWNESQNSGSGIESESYTIEFFDFSNTGALFLGGGVGTLYIEEETESANSEIEYETEKFNGSIRFRGNFEGRIVFDNVVFTYKTRWTKDAFGDWKREVLQNDVSGNFYVESNGNRVSLDKDLLWYLLWPKSNNIDYGNAPINLTMPAVLSAPNGSLGNRGGVNVTESNRDNFFAFLNTEMYARYRSARNSEWSGNFEFLEHGSESGYMRVKHNETGRGNNSGEISAGNGTVEYFDYSNTGRLYLGGGLGFATITRYFNEGSLQETEESKQSGTIRFNGDFSGSLVFNNFHIKLEYGQSTNYRDVYTHVGGTITLNGNDVTQWYMSMLSNDAPTPGPGPGITLGGSVTVNVGAPTNVNVGINQTIQVNFTAPSTGIFIFYSANNTGSDPIAFSNANGSHVIDDDGAGERNFSFLRTLAAGETFTFFVGEYYGNGGIFQVHVLGVDAESRDNRLVNTVVNEAWIDDYPVGNRVGFIIREDGTFARIDDWEGTWQTYFTGTWFTVDNNILVLNVSYFGIYNETTTFPYTFLGNNQLIIDGDWLFNRTQNVVIGNVARANSEISASRRLSERKKTK